MNISFLINPIYDLGVGLQFLVTANHFSKGSNHQLYIGTMQFGKDTPLNSIYYVGDRTTLYRSKDRSLMVRNSTEYRYLRANHGDAGIHQIMSSFSLKKTIGKMRLLGDFNVPVITKESDPDLFRVREKVRNPFTVGWATYSFLPHFELGLAQYRTDTYLTALIGPLMVSYNLSDTSENMVYIGVPWISY